MPVYGDLRTVSLVELLNWASRNQKTGVLEVERNAICRRVEFRKGWVGSCSSNDPATLMGQYLLSRGRLNETQLQHLLTLRRLTRKRLGLLIVEMQILSRSELAEIVSSRAKETIYSLFDWEDAFFRFDDGATLDPDQIEVNLSVDDLIAEGLKRGETLAEIRGTFISSGVVLDRTEHELPPEITGRRITRRILESIDGDRTIAEVLLYTRGSEFLVLKLLHRLLARDLLVIKEVRNASPGHPTLLDSSPMSIRSFDEPLANAEVDRALTQMVPPDPVDEPGDLDLQIKTATTLIEKKEFEAAVELLRSGCREYATDYLRRLLAQAETAFVNSVREDESFVSRVPVLQRDRRLSNDGDPEPEESFLLSLVDGKTDVQSILWLSPLRDVDVLMGLRRLARKNLIELVDAAELSVEQELAAP